MSPQLEARCLVVELLAALRDDHALSIDGNPVAVARLGFAELKLRRIFGIKGGELDTQSKEGRTKWMTP